MLQHVTHTVKLTVSE